MLRLIRRKPSWFGEGDHDDRNPARLELIFECPHLAEVGLARQSGEMSEKDQQKVIMKALLELYRVTVQIEQGQAIQGDRVHQGSSGFTVKEYSPQRGCAAPQRGQSPLH
jgi:hypothetical protein